MRLPCHSSGFNALAITADLSNENEIIRAVKYSHEHWGQTDILINNAASCIQTSFHSGDSKDWQYMWQVNVMAPSIAIQESLKHFNKNIGGHIVNISSTSGHRIVKGGSFYSVTKFALRALSETLRKELIEVNSKTRVSSISPGVVNTSFAQNNNFIVPDNLDKEKLDPEDIASIVLFILQTPEHLSIQDIILRSAKQYS